MKKLKNTLFIFLLIFGCLGFSRNVQAEVLIKEKTITVGGYDDKTIFSFRHDGYSLYYVYVETKVKNSSDSVYADDDDLTFTLYDADSWDSMLDVKIGKNQGGFIYAGGDDGDDDFEIDGRYDFEISNNSPYDYRISYKVLEYQGVATDIKLASQVSLKVDEIKTIKINSVIPYGSYPVAKWKSRNKNIVEVNDLGEIWGKKVGMTYVTATLSNGKQKTCKVTVTGRPPQMNYKKFTMVTQSTLKAELLYADGNIKWSSSNPKVATVSSKGTIKAKSIGECTITARYKKVNYTARVVVKRQFPKYEAKITQYNTRDNYFVVSFANSSNKPLTVYSSGARVEDKDYRSYDRYLYLSNSSITIPAKKTVSVKFYVSGGITWYQYRDFTLIYRMSFDGGNYDAKVYYNINEPGYWKSIFKRGNKWYYTGH